MWSHVSLCLGVLCVFVPLVESRVPSARFSVWPQPAHFDFDNTSLARLDAQSFEFQSNAVQGDATVLQQAFERYRQYIFDGASTSDAVLDGMLLPVLNSLQVVVDTSGSPLELGVDESYELTITTLTVAKKLSVSASVHAKTVWGALRGLETFSQLVSEDLLLGGNVSVIDAPRFKWRGLLVDTGRHFLPVDVLEKTIDGVAMQKMNVLHWHITDAQSFPLQVEAYPELTRQGAYRFPVATYSRKDVAHIVQFAHDRGVRVVLEVETPGHAASWGYGMPEIVTSCPNFHASLTSQLDRIPLDISQNLTYEVVESVVRETAEYVPDQFLHIGGDEVQFGCWNASQNMHDWMAKNGFALFEEAEAFYMSRVIEMAKRHGQRRVVVWQESFDNSQSLTNASLVLPRAAVVEFWSNRSTFAKALNLGHDVLMAEGWYMDLSQPGLRRGRRQDSWMDFYNLDPTVGAEGVDPDILAKHLLGGEAGMWGEEIDAANLLDSVFPRSSAVAERLHTPLNRIGNAGDPTISQLQLASKVTQRLEVFRCTLWRRGIQAGPVAWPSYCSGPTREHQALGPLTAPTNAMNGMQLPICFLASGLSFGALLGIAIGWHCKSRSIIGGSRVAQVTSCQKEGAEVFLA